MRVATYTQSGAPTRGSVFAVIILVLTILLGSGVIPTLAKFVGGPAERVLTPLWLLLYISGLLGLMFKHGINWISWLVRYRILLVVLLLGTILSVSWALDSKVSAERTVHLVGSSLLAIYIGFSVPLLTTLRVFAVVMGIFVVTSIGAALGLPALGIENYEGITVWRGVFNSKNDLGFWTAVGVLLYITLSDSTQRTSLKLLCFLLAGACLGLLALSQSATSLLAMLVSGALALYLFIASRFQLGFIRMAFMAILFVAVVTLAIANIDTAELVGRTDDLTGRGEVWAQTWKLILERPLTGLGYGVLWFPTDDTIWIQQSMTDFTWVVYHAHNGLLQVASEIGMPLAMIALLMVAQQLIEIFYCQYERQQAGVLFVLAFVVAYLISNFSEARFLINRELFWIFFLTLPISMLRQINLVSPEDEAEDENEPLGSRTTAAYSAVPGKPWLGPLPHELAAPAAAAAATAWGSDQPAGARAPALQVDWPREAGAESETEPEQEVESNSEQGSDQSSGLNSELEFTGGLPDADEDSELEYADDFEYITATVSLDETDIDLGDLEETVVISEDVLHSENLDDSDPDGLPPYADGIIDMDDSNERDRLDYNDTMGDELDRYEKHLDLTGEWIDISLDDKDKDR